MALLKCLVPALVLLAAIAPAAAVVEVRQCQWAGAFCDLSSAYVVKHIADFNATGNATATAILKAATKDAACAARATVDDCIAAPWEAGCEWFDAETLPSCVAPDAVDREIAAALTCPGTLAQLQSGCAPIVNADRCGAAPDCVWDKTDETCRAKKLQGMIDSPDKAKALEAQYNKRDPAIFGNCTSLKTLFTIQDVCPITANFSTCPRPNCAFDGSTCVHTQTLLMKLAGLANTSEAFAAATACNAATTRNSCAEVGAPIQIANATLSAAALGDIAAVKATAASGAAAAAAAGLAPLLAMLAAAAAAVL
ncbi:hypothetical protein Rsub_02131 [Raphidocelis subcapitata]|uniref:Secreted protein n=1 Tax=Raphidocelis subcapitata TaxID=307507 RepID=A0A2V0NNU0_9CHLO|nr:hypothetical protein Rsub_02131 [Raphidocelis subcapitata]|eukprot:GBF89254.1 hypothetical protein Rsub_02131 [Raphidocelis subcapitata]